MAGKRLVAYLTLALVGHGLAMAADPTPLRIQGTKGELIVDARGIHLAPAIASCPAIQGQGGLVWSIALQTEQASPRQGVTLNDQRQTVRRQTTPDGVRLCYETLTDGNRVWKVGLALDIQRRGDAFEVTGQITNQEPGWHVCGFTGPMLDGIQADLATHPALMPEGFGRRVHRVPDGKGKLPRPWHMAGKHLEITTRYPSALGTMQWCALAGEQGGLYFGCHDATSGAKSLALRYDPETRRFGLLFRHDLLAATGQQWTVPPMVILPYEGDWHTAARCYRVWADSVAPPRRVPAWVQSASGWLLCILKQQNGEVLWNYPSLEKLCDVADQRGLDIVGLFGWAHGGHDHLYPEYHPDPLMGGEQALRKALKEVHRRGKRSIIYANGQLIERDTEFWKTQGKDLAVIQKSGVAVQETWHKFKNAPAYQFDVACLAANAWYDRLLSLAIQANDLGADGILYDQLGMRGPMVCCATGHGHPAGATVYVGERRVFLRRIADHMKNINPDFIVMTEGLHDSVLDSISLFHGCVLGMFTDTVPETLAGLHAKSGSAAFPEMFRYTFPEVMSTIRVPTPMMNRLMANYTCAYGLRYEIESRYASDVQYLKDNRMPQASDYEQVISKPEISMMLATPPEQATRYLKQVIEFQRANADLFWRGRFTDAEGFTFKGQNLVAKGFAADNRIGVLVWNPGSQSATFTVEVPQAELIAASEPEQGRVGATSPLAPETVRLLVWKKK